MPPLDPRRSSSAEPTNRNRFTWWLRRKLIEEDAGERHYCFEPLEARELLAADLEEWVPQRASMADSAFYASLATQSAAASSSVMTAEGEPGSESLSLQAEGEPAPDLVAFAAALRDAGVTFFGAAWCEVCTEQKRLFQDGQTSLDFVEVTNPDRSLNARGEAENITTYPTWQFQDGSRATGLQTLEQLSALSGIAIPTSENPFLSPIANQTVQINSPLHVPVDAYDPNGGPITVTVTSSVPGSVTAEVVTGGRSARISTNFGDMVFRLFEAEASRPTGRFITLAQSGFYDTNSTNGDRIFHRVVDDFVIQGGDPTGTGSGGSGLGNFDDQFDVDLQHNRSGVLSYAKSTDDTNDSQFFVTEVATQFLNANHSVFGQMVEGDEVREAISETAVNSSDKPVNNVVIQSVTIFDDIENGLLRLRATGAAGQTSTITVTVTDSSGRQTSRNFTATVADKTNNDPPFLNDISSNVTITQGQSAQVQLASQDAEGNPVQYFVSSPTASGVQYTASVNQSTGVVTITPPASFTGSFDVTVGVAASQATTASDNQRVRLTVNASGPAAPTGIDLVTDSDSGTSNSDNVTNASSLTFDIAGTVSGATVELLADGSVIGTATATGTTTSITTSALTSDGTVTLTARQSQNGQTSALSSPLTVVVDRAVPAEAGLSNLPSSVIIGQATTIDLNTAEEGNGLRYALSTAPAGATIDASTGVISWTATSDQAGSQAFVLLLTDVAGNTTTQNFSLNVVQPPLVKLSLRAVDAAGNPLSELSVGQEFQLQLLATDLRTEEADGVFSAFADIIYDTNRVSVFGTTPITYGSGFDLAPTGSVATPGLIDELGAARSSFSTSLSSTVVVASVSMRADAAGQAVFTTESADDADSDTAVYGRNGEIPFDQLVFENLSLSVGRPFDAVDDSFNVPENSVGFLLDVFANDPIRSGTPDRTITAVSTPSSGGSVTIDGTQLRYTPPTNFTGGDTFTYTVTDSVTGTVDTATVTINVDDVNQAPTAVGDTATVDRNSTQNVISVLANDSSAPDVGETLQILSVSTPTAGGTATIINGGTQIAYTPPANFSGTDTLTYVLSDGRGGTATASVTVNVAPAVPPPTAVADAFTVTEDATAAEFDVLANDQPSISGETLTIGSATASAGGSVTVTANGTRIQYLPAPNFTGTETVQYVLRGSNGGQTIGVVTFTVTPVNDPPTAVDDALTVLSQPNQTVDVLANDTNVDAGETLRITAVTQPPAGQGTVSIAADGRSLLYSAPNTNFEATVSFSYTLSDGTLTDTANVTLTVRNYVPRSIGGQVLVAGASSNLYTTLNLSGTAVTGETINRSVAVDTSGRFVASSLPPGTYTFTAPNLSFRASETAGLTIVSGINDGDSLNNTLVIGSLLPQFVDVRDFLGRSTGRGLGLAIEPGQVQQWYSASGRWRDYTSISIAMNAAGSELTINTVDSTGRTGSAKLALSSPLVQSRGTDGTMRYLRIVGEPGDLNLPLPPAAAGSQLAAAAIPTSTSSTAASTNSESAASNDDALAAMGDLSAEGEGALFSDVALLLKPSR